MQCILLGAGYATRLYPLTRNRPKPLLPVGGEPILSRICSKVLEVPDWEKICIVSNHRFVRHYRSWLDDLRCRVDFSCEVVILDDETTSNEDRLGAIGDLQFAITRGEIDDDVLIVAGDNLFEFPLPPFVQFGREKGIALALKELGGTERVELYGTVETDKTARVVDFEEKPFRPRSSLVSTGVYFFSREHLHLIREYLAEGRSPDRFGDYIQWLVPRAGLFGYVVDGDWFDIGDIDSYNEANIKYLSS